MPSDYSTPPSQNTKAASTKSPFFRPSGSNSSFNTDIDTANENENGSQFFRTPGGNTRRVTPTKPPNGNAADEPPGSNSDSSGEHKSTVLGCASNLVNSIVGSGIVGLPFAIQESGFLPGVLLVLGCGLLTDTSLRLLIETAKHSNVPSYETVAEAAYGNFGFYFVAINMFIMSYGAMLSYLMIVKDTFSSILGFDDEDLLGRRAVLVVISSLVMLPLSCQRDMADLAKTSKMNVCFDLIMVLLVVYLAFHHGDYEEQYEDATELEPYSFEDYSDLWKIRWDTIFVGLGVLSFAFVCQHSSFIIAGSLERPTKERWSLVTKVGVGFAVSLALLMGICGYLGFGRNGVDVQGNILNSLPQGSPLSKVAKGLLGTTMLFVYPMESFVARHACVVLLFEGRKAHEGDDSSVLSRRDRRITLTVALYLSAVIPAALFESLGGVLAITGAVGGSSLSYIGPGIVYLGIHGGRFLELSKSFFGRELVSNTIDDSDSSDEEDSIPLVDKNITPDSSSNSDCDCDGFLCKSLKSMLWYIMGMPIWTALASKGKGSLTTYVTEMALKSPHPIRIGNVRFARAKVRGGDSYTRVVMLQNQNQSQRRYPPRSAAEKALAFASGRSESERSEDSASANSYNGHSSLTTGLIRADSLPKLSKDSYRMQTTRDGTIVALPPTLYQPRKQITVRKNFHGNGNSNGNGIVNHGTHMNNNNSNYQSINQKIGVMAAAAADNASAQQNSIREGEDIAIEDDPQGDPPRPWDFAIAIFYILFGVIAMFAGLGSIYLQ